LIAIGESAIENRQLAITRPTRYREVVLTSWVRNYRNCHLGLKLHHGQQLTSSLILLIL
jgi:hypothetical protein